MGGSGESYISFLGGGQEMNLFLFLFYFKICVLAAILLAKEAWMASSFWAHQHTWISWKDVYSHIIWDSNCFQWKSFNNGPHFNVGLFGDFVISAKMLKAVDRKQDIVKKIFLIVIFQFDSGKIFSVLLCNIILWHKHWKKSRKKGF